MGNIWRLSQTKSHILSLQVGMGYLNFTISVIGFDMSMYLCCTVSPCVRLFDVISDLTHLSLDNSCLFVALLSHISIVHQLHLRFPNQVMYRTYGHSDHV